MAVATISLYSVCSCLLRSPRTLTKAVSLSQFTPQCSSFKLGFNPLQPRSTLPARKLVVRAARTESRGLSLGFRAPNFEVLFMGFFCCWSFSPNEVRIYYSWIFVWDLVLDSRATYRESLEIGGFWITSCFTGEFKFYIYVYLNHLIWNLCGLWFHN